TDTESQRAKGAVRAGMTIAANNRHSRLRQTEFRPDNMNNALLGRIDVKKLNVEFATILTKGFDLFCGDCVGDGQTTICCGYVVVHSCNRQVGTTNTPTCRAQGSERLRRCDLMDQVQIDVEKRRLTRALPHDVRVPELFEQCAWHKGLVSSQNGIRQVIT